MSIIGKCVLCGKVIIMPSEYSATIEGECQACRAERDEYIEAQFKVRGK